MGNAGHPSRRSVWKRICDKLHGTKEARVLMFGLDAAGKTTVLYRLKFGRCVTTIPTIGFNIETVCYKNVNFTAWDLGGGDKIRALWKHYTTGADVIIYVVDSDDRERISECKDELWRFLQDDELKDCVLLVMANKQDLPNAMSTAEVTERMELNALRNRTWYIQSTCAITGDGLYEGLSWLKEQLVLKQVTKTVTKPLQET